MKATLLLQARTNSSRLPAKVLLPVGGVPLVVLAARRAGNAGHPVKVVTSRESSDDLLCEVLSTWGIDYFRGELENTLKRFVDAIEGMADDHVIVRLTGDNVFPDGEFIDEMLQDFNQRGLAYLGCGGELSGLPYGVSAEVTRAGCLREAHRETNSRFEREHVTPWIIARYGRCSFERYRSLGMAHYRCTVDTLDDYLSVARLFAHSEQPEQASLASLLERLKAESPDVVTETPATRMVLGTAQFGLNYGIANSWGQPQQPLVNELVRTAIRNGVPYLDTARVYGDSEQVLGTALAEGWSSRTTVITKLSPLDDCPADASPEVVKAFAERSVYQSCRMLGVARIGALLLHRASHLMAWNGAVWDTVNQLKQHGIIGELGVSVQSPEEALMALEKETVSIIQLPFNILDFRWESVITKISEVRKQRQLTIHARSALLQGLLTTRQRDLWKRARCSNAEQVLDWLNKQATQRCHGDVVDLCVRYVLSQKWIDGIVMGVDTKEQLFDNLKIMGTEPWSDEQLVKVVQDRPQVPRETLDPSSWIKADV
ncbi:aldo/keto reductase [Marinobacter segnicrescens]|uniref:aldo/keto reductase n=1 Tax=Marinobacter segnicrescens TaxID=430453 RepID=UPI003A8D00F5